MKFKNAEVEAERQKEQAEQKELDKKYFIPNGKGFQFNRSDKYFIDMTAEEFVNAYNEGKKWRMKSENNKLLRELNILD